MKTFLPRIASLSLACLAATSVATAQVPFPTQPHGEAPPPALRVDDLLERGRTHLLRGGISEANAIFEEAQALHGETFEVRRWILRTWMEMGRSNDTLNAIDDLRRAGHEGPVMDYLYGVAFAKRAEKHLADGVRDASVQMNFDDAVSILDPLLATNPDEFADAWLPLATAAWYAQKLDVARNAIDHALELAPTNIDVVFLRGRIALSQFQVARDPASVEPGDWSARTQRLWSDARSSFTRTLELCRATQSTSGAPADLAQLADAAVQLGHTLVWKGLKAKAADAYGEALSWAPERVDLGQIRGVLAPADPDGPHDHFHKALVRASHDYDHRFENDTRDAAMLWWLGYSHYARDEHVEAIRTFEDCLATEPGFTNAWHYLALARYGAGRFSEAADTFLAGWNVDPPTMLAEITGDLERVVPKLEYLAGVAFRETKLEKAARLNEMCAEAVGNEPRHWNNMGMLLRDEADRRRWNADTDDIDEEAIMDLYERSYVAYSRALRLVPDDPQVINDTAVMLHYYLIRDLDRAMEMYQRAIAIAEERLAEEGISEEDRARFETALSDASGNVPKLEQLIELIREAEGETELGSS